MAGPISLYSRRPPAVGQQGRSEELYATALQHGGIGSLTPRGRRYVRRVILWRRTADLPACRETWRRARSRISTPPLFAESASSNVQGWLTICPQHIAYEGCPFCMRRQPLPARYPDGPLRADQRRPRGSSRFAGLPPSCPADVLRGYGFHFFGHAETTGRSVTSHTPAT